MFTAAPSTLAVISHPPSQPQPSLVVTAPVITRLSLINTDTQTVVTVLDGTNKTIDLAHIGTSNLTIRAGTSGTVQSVQWAVNGNANFAIANASPYSLAGKNSTGGLNKASVLTNGAFTITATSFTLMKAAGTAGAGFTVKFTLVNGTA